MKANSHRLLGQYLVQQYLSHCSSLQQRAFLLGCVEPDKNPTTYLKGSLRAQMLRGHHYGSAKKYIRRLCNRLDRRDISRLWDYYTLGKLMHYLADAFTYAHNDHFPGDLKAHREYEGKLHECLAAHLWAAPSLPNHSISSPTHFIAHKHRQYVSKQGGVHNDAAYIFQVCCRMMCLLLPDRAQSPQRVEAPA